MTEEPKVDNVVEEGAVSPSASAVSDSAPAPIADVAMKEKLSELEQQLRGLQGRQDKADTKMTSQQEAIARYDAYLDAGLSKPEAKKAMAQEDKVIEEDNRLRRIEETLVILAGGKVVDSDVNALPETTRLIEELELDANTPEVVAIKAQGLSPEMEELELRRLKSQPKKVANSPSPKTTSPVVPESEAALVKKYVEELQAAGTDRSAAAGIREKYEGLGVRTGAVSFH